MPNSDAYDHRGYISVQFYADPSRVRDILRATIVALEAVGAHKFKPIQIGNLKTQEEAVLDLVTLKDRLENGEDVMEE